MPLQEEDGKSGAGKSTGSLAMLAGTVGRLKNSTARNRAHKVREVPARACLGPSFLANFLATLISRFNRDFLSEILPDPVAILRKGISRLNTLGEKTTGSKNLAEEFVCKVQQTAG